MPVNQAAEENKKILTLDKVDPSEIELPPTKVIESSEAIAAQSEGKTDKLSVSKTAPMFRKSLTGLNPVNVPTL